MARKKTKSEDRDIVGEAIPLIMGITRKLSGTVIDRLVAGGMDKQVATLSALKENSTRSFAEAMNEFAGKRDTEFYITRVFGLSGGYFVMQCRNIVDFNSVLM